MIISRKPVFILFFFPHKKHVIHGEHHPYAVMVKKYNNKYIAGISTYYF